MIGFIARCDNSGLGMESLEFVEHIRPDKLLVLKLGFYRQFPERFHGATVVGEQPDAGTLSSFLAGLDVLFTIETPYDWDIFRMARRQGVRTILRINYEWLPDPVPVTPDVMVAPIEWHRPAGAILLPFPVNRRKIPFRKRSVAHTFVHVAGHIGGHDRNGTAALLRGIPLVRSDVRFIVYSQRPLPAVGDPRLTCRIANYVDNSCFYEEGDALVLPRRYGGQALSMNEALSAGMPVLMTGMPPQNALLPPEFLIPVRGLETIQIRREIEAAVLDPALIAAKIDEWANRDIGPLSDWADRYAETISWEVLLPRYRALLGR